MNQDTLLESRMSAQSYAKLAALKNQKVMDFIGFFVAHCDPASVYTFRCTKWIEKLERTKAFYARMDPNTPREIFAYWDAAIAKIMAARDRFGDQIRPGDYLV